MSIPLLIPWILAKMILALDSAFIGNDILDPIIPNFQPHKRSSILDKDNSQEEIRKQYDGYIFNQNRCIQFNDRILCGYDTNKGTQLDDYTMLDVGNGCRARGDRIECGYYNPQYNKNLRPHAKHGVHDAQKGDNHYYKENHMDENLVRADIKHRVQNSQADDNHFHQENHGDENPVKHIIHDMLDGFNHHHHSDQLYSSSIRQTPTRTTKSTNANFQSTIYSTILNRIKTDDLKNELLKSIVDIVVTKNENTSKTTIQPISSGTREPLTITTTKPPLSSLSTSVSSQLSKLTTRKVSTTIFSKNLESNEISSNSEKLNKIVKFVPIEEQMTRRLSKILLSLPKSRSKFVLDGNIVPPIAKNSDIRDRVLRESEVSEDKATTACVEQNERVVCYDFTT